MFKEIMEFPFVYGEGKKILEDNIKGLVLDVLILRCIQVKYIEYEGGYRYLVQRRGTQMVYKCHLKLKPV